MHAHEWLKTREFAEEVGAEIEAEFDHIRPDWRLYRDQDGRPHGVMFGWGFTDNELQCGVSDAGEQTALFEEAIRRAFWHIADRYASR
ncbi:hypothetical protein EPN44_02680 [bacterium]|nr:MAG: hypothetical protein EPN44_02680 [bacterium]